MKIVIVAALAAVLAPVALAKLPPLSDEAKAKAAEAAAKTAWSGKVDAYQLCRAQDRVAAFFFTSAKAAGKEARPPVETAVAARMVRMVFFMLFSPGGRGGVLPADKDKMGRGPETVGSS